VRLRRLVCHRARSARSTLCLSIAPAGLVFQQALTALCAATCCDSTPGWRKRWVASPVVTLRTTRCSKKLRKSVTTGWPLR